MESKYKIKTKEVKPKVYSMLFVNREKKLQVIKLILAYSFEDAVGVGRHWIAKAFNVSLADSLKYEPSMYESVPAESLVEFVIDGEEKIISDTNSIMRKIVETEGKKEAQQLLEQYRSQLSDTSIKYLEDEIVKKKTKLKVTPQ